MQSESKQTVKIEKIIALKRFEQPPPGYFQLLPDRVINRIQHGEGRAGFWEKWWLAFCFRPGLAYALGLAVCGTLAVEIYWSPKADQTAGVAGTSSAQLWAVTSSDAPATVDAPLDGARWLGSTNPVMAPRSGDSLFLTSQAEAIPVSLFQP
jgi:hypothetical protein